MTFVIKYRAKSSDFPRRVFFLQHGVFCNVVMSSLLPCTRNLPYKDDNNKEEKKKGGAQNFLNTTSVTFMTTVAYRILKSGQTKLLWSKIMFEVLYMLHTILL